MENNIKYYIRIWKRLTLSSFQTSFTSQIGAIIFTIGKIIRFIFFLLLVLLIVTKTKALAGYNLNQSLIFYLTFNVIDSLTQLLFRDVYRFREKIVSGDFDLTLSKPSSPLFRILLGGTDPLDLIAIIPYLILLIIFITFFATESFFSPLFLIYYFILIINSLIIAASFHIFVLSLGILTTEIDHSIMIYRDLTSMGRFPIDIYKEPLRGFITFIIPVGMMMTFPPKALFGLLSPAIIVLSGAIGMSFLFLSLKLWRFSLSQYSSASS